MTKRTILAALAGAVVFWFWGFIWFGVSPMGNLTVAPMPEAGMAAVEALKASGLSSGTYYSPHWAGDGQADEAKLAEAFAAGPLVMVHLTQGGAVFQDPMLMLKGFLHFLASTLLVALLAGGASASLETYRDRWAFLVLFGVAAAVFSRFGPAVWYTLPMGHFAWYGLYDVTGWILAGAAMAKLLAPKDAG